MIYRVFVGNIGQVYSGDDYDKAMVAFNEYREQSQTDYGRAAGENVTMFEGDEPKHEYTGTLETEETVARQERLCPNCHQPIWDFAFGSKLNKCWNCFFAFESEERND